MEKNKKGEIHTSLYFVEITLLYSFGDEEESDLYQDIIAIVRGKEEAQKFVQEKKLDWLDSWSDPKDVDEDYFEFSIKELSEEEIGNLISYHESRPYRVTIRSEVC